MLIKNYEQPTLTIIRRLASPVSALASVGAVCPRLGRASSTFLTYYSFANRHSVTAQNH